MRHIIQISAFAALLFVPFAVQADDYIFANGFEVPSGGGATGTDFVNDSGASACYGSSGYGVPCPNAGFPGQDGDQGRDAEARQGILAKIGAGLDGFDFTKVDNLGAPLGPTASQWECVQDNVTGLLWERNVDKVSDARHYRHLYAWYEPALADLGVNPGSQGDTDLCNNSLGGAKCNTHNLLQHFNTIGLCGRHDWRLPTRSELESIRIHGDRYQRMDPDYFSPWGINTSSGSFSYWTSSRYAGSGYSVWAVNFSSTGTTHGDVPNRNFVRAVSGRSQ